MKRLTKQVRPLGGLLLLVGLWLAAGCTPTLEPAASEANANATIVVERQTPTGDEVLPQPSPSITPTPSATPYPSPLPPNLTPTITPVIDTVPTATPAPPFAGMIYRNEMGLWQVDENWQPVLRFDKPEAVLSPDGQRVAFMEGDDVWVVDLTNGQQTNVTADTTNRHTFVQWWPARPETLILGSRPSEADDSPDLGQLTVVNVDGSDYRVLADTASFAMPDPSPDGQTIAFDTAGSGMMYYWESDFVEAFDPYFYGLPEGVTVARIASPSWSPDGGSIAWVMAVEGGGYGGEAGWEIVVGVFHTEATLLHPFTPIGRGGWFFAPVWSPDGRWLAFEVESVDEGERLWVTAVDGSSEVSLGPGYNPLFSPDGHWLVFNDELLNSEFPRLYEVGSWYPTNLWVPGELVEWR